MYPLIIAGTVTATFTGIYFAYNGCCQKRKNPKTATDLSQTTDILPLYYAFETTLDYLDRKKAIGTEMILREPGATDTINIIYDFMIQNKELKSLLTSDITQPYNIQDVISALKKVMTNFLKPELFDGQSLYSALSSATDNNFAGLYKAHIQELIYKNKADTKAARVLHNLVHICFNVLKNQQKNGMSSEAIANIFAPRFATLFGLPETVLFDTKAKNKITFIIQSLVTSNLFSSSFGKTNYHRVRPKLK